MKTYIVAGHEFPDTIDACCIRVLPDGSVCGKSWAFVCEATDADVGKPDKPHVPNLTSNELLEIRAEEQRREEQKERAMAAVMDLSKR